MVWGEVVEGFFWGGVCSVGFCFVQEACMQEGCSPSPARGTELMI